MTVDGGVGVGHAGTDALYTTSTIVGRTGRRDDRVHRFDLTEGPLLHRKRPRSGDMLDQYSMSDQHMAPCAS